MSSRLHGNGGGERGAAIRRALAGVHSVGPMCSVFCRMCPVSGPMCPVFGRMCSVSRGVCPLWRAKCPVFGGAPWLGMGRGRKARFLGSAALGMTTAAGADRGRGWWGLAMTAVQAMQSVHGLLSGQGALGEIAVAPGATPVCGRTLGTGCDGYHGGSIKGAAPVRAAGTVEIGSAGKPTQQRGARVRELVQSRTGTGSSGNR